MILIFDLDDTLYPEQTYVNSGFKAVAAWLDERFGWNPAASLAFMLGALEQEGRGTIFNRLLSHHGILTKSLVGDCIRIYRHHRPHIALFPSALRFLGRPCKPLYLVTDGHKIVQQEKVRALGIEDRFKKIFITHRYGLVHAKPSTYCFERIREIEKCAWKDMAYIGDNPTKDFVKLKPLGVLTVRVLTGHYRGMVARPDHEAAAVISDFDELPSLLETRR